MSNTNDMVVVHDLFPSGRQCEWKGCRRQATCSVDKRALCGRHTKFLWVHGNEDATALGQLMLFVILGDPQLVIDHFRNTDPQHVRQVLVGMRNEFDAMIGQLTEQVLDDLRPTWPDPKVN